MLLCQVPSLFQKTTWPAAEPATQKVPSQAQAPTCRSTADVVGSKSSSDWPELWKFHFHCNAYGYRQTFIRVYQNSGAIIGSSGREAVEEARSARVKLNHTLVGEVEGGE